jgi:signal transduction histidine kinase
MNPRVRIWAETAPGDPSAIRIWFEDNGIGIAEKHLKKMFQLFQQLNEAGTYEGTGIGLAIVRKAVERMGGRVGVESKLGKGSHFWVELPAAKTETILEIKKPSLLEDG